MASLQELLTGEGFDEHKKLIRNQKKVKFRDRTSQDESRTLHNIFICHDQRSFPSQKPNIDKASSRNDSSRKGDSESGRSVSVATEVGFPRTASGPAIDEVAIRAVVSILNGYIGQYLRDKKFRESIKANCYSCFMRRNQDSDDGIFANLELGIESIERFVENQGTKKELRMKSVQHSIRLLNIVASLNSKCSKNCSTCGIPNSHLSACAQLYLSILYKIEKNGRISARHLLQVFCDAPFLARTHLLPELWEHLFLPHLLHLKIWYSEEELDFLSNSNYVDKEMKMKALEEAYNAQMDIGTTKFALYYKGWLKVGAQAPSVPFIPLPVRQSISLSRRYSDSFSPHSSNNLLYRAVFGTIPESFSLDFNKDEDSSHRWILKEKDFSIGEELEKHSSYDRKSTRHRRSSSLGDRRVKTDLWPANQKPDHFRILNCRSGTTEFSVHVVPNASVEEDRCIWKSNLHRAVKIICTSDSICECEMAIRVMTKAWLDSHGNPMVETELSKSQLIQGILEVLSVSDDDEILELSISLLVQIVTKKELVGNILLNFDPQLDIFLKLLRNNSIFLKAAALLYLIKPEAKQMISLEWIPLVLRVLEFGDQLQTFFTLQVSPQTAAYYFFNQLLMHFDEDKNKENARHVVTLGGLNLLLRRLEKGDTNEKNKAVSIICCCVQADGSSRHYLAKNMNKESLISLLFHRNPTGPQGHAFALLTEIFCLHRHHQRIELLTELRNEWSNLNTMHVLLVYLQRAQPEERPMVAAMLLQLDLLGDCCECSVYREEAIEEIVRAMDCQVLNEKIQEQSAKALHILGSHFSYTGETITEKWLLTEAGLNENSWDTFEANNVVSSDHAHLVVREKDDMETWWQRKTAMVLLKNGDRRLLVALSDAIENGIPCLARASLVTVSWISSVLQSMEEQNLQSVACSVLLPQLLQALDFDKTIEERTLASFSLLNLLKGSEYVGRSSESHKELLIKRLQKLSQVTRTAQELISIIKSSLRN